MKNNQKQSLLTIMFVGATMAAPLVAQDLATALKDVEAERYTKAEQTLTQLATSSPSAENEFYLGYYYLKSGQPDKAKAAFDKGAAADPKDQLNNVGLAGVALMKKDLGKAKTLIDEAVAKTKGKDIGLLVRAAEMYTLSEQTNDPAEALRLLAMAEERDKKHENPEIPMTMGDAYFLKNDGGNAITKYENAMAIKPDLAEANYKIGRLYLRGKNYTEAQKYFNKAIETDPQFSPTYLALADALANSRAYKGASANYEKYVQTSGTTDPEQLLDIARYKFLAQDYQGAITYLDQLKGKINNPIIDRMYGWANTALDKNQEAVQSLNKFIAEAPQKVIYDDYKYLGRAYGKLGTPEGDSLSIVNLEKAAPEDTTENLYREIGENYYKSKKYDKAADYYAKTIKNDKKPLNNDYLYKGLANYQQGFRVGRDTTAAPMDTAQIRMGRELYFLRADSAFAEMALQVEKTAGETYPLAYYYRAQSNYYAYPSAISLSTGSAVPFYEKFIEMANAETDTTKKKGYLKNLITSYKFLASYNLAKKDDEKAKEYFNKILELDPNDADVKKALEGPAPAPSKPAAKAPVKKKTAGK